MESLADIMGTKYLGVQHENKLRNVLDSLNEVDIKGMHFTRVCSEIITQFCMDGVIVRDSEDPDRDAIYQENRRRYLCACDIDEDKYSPLPMIEDVSPQGLIDYIKSLEPDKLYTTGSLPTKVYIPLIEIISWYRPTIQLCIGNSYAEVISDVFDILNRGDIMRVVETCHDNRYMVVIQHSCIPLTITEKTLRGKFNIAGLGDTTWDDILSLHCFLPMYFGEVAGNKQPPEIAELYQPVLTSAVRRLQEFVAKLPTTAAKTVDSTGTVHYRKNTMAYALQPTM